MTEKMSTNEMKKVKVTNEVCPYCESQDIELSTPYDDESYMWFYVECNSCKGNYTVVPEQEEYFIIKKGEIHD